MKKLISIILSMVMLASVAVPGFSAFAVDSCGCGNTPVVYVNGKSSIYADPMNPDRAIIDRNEEEIKEMVVKILPSLGFGLLTDNWEPYCNDLYDVVTSIFKDYSLSDEGTVVNGSGPNDSGLWHGEALDDRHNNGDIRAYRFFYDARTDPWVIADTLNGYIQAVKVATGHDKVSLVSRCIGTNITMAYLAKYGAKNGYSDIESCIFYNGMIGGCALAGEVYSNRMKFDPDSADRFASDILDTSTVNELISASISLVNAGEALGVGTDLVNKIYSKVSENVIPRIMKSTYATLPGYWSMISDEYYDDAKAFLFEGEQERFSKLIDKIDNVHYNVTVKTPEIVNEMQNEYGINVAFLCKYGLQAIPVTESSGLIGDSDIELVGQSLGATCSDVAGTLSDSYIDSLADKRYISPDRQIDASTGISPDYTWFVKDLTHDCFPPCLNELFWAIIKYDGRMTVRDNEKFPQYLLYIDDNGDDDDENGRVVPLTDDNKQTNDWTDSSDRAKVLLNFFIALIKAIREYFANLSSK